MRVRMRGGGRSGEQTGSSVERSGGDVAVWMDGGYVCMAAHLDWAQAAGVRLGAMTLCPAPIPSDATLLRSALRAAIPKNNSPRPMSSTLAPRRLPRCLRPVSTACSRSLRRSISNNSSPLRPGVIFSGIQPTGIPHLGNYLGALQQWAKLQDEAAPSTTLIYCVVDLHAITIRQEPEQLRQWRKEMLASLLAVGLDPKRSIIFNQSSVCANFPSAG